MKVGYLSSIYQPLLLKSEFKTRASRCCENQFWTLLLFMMVNGFYSNKLIWGGARLCGGNNSTTSLFFVLRWLSIFWNTNGCLLDTSRCLTLRAENAVQICFPADLSMLPITFTALTHWLNEKRHKLSSCYFRYLITSPEQLKSMTYAEKDNISTIFFLFW